MKARINITIEEAVLQKIKVYAAKQQISLSQLIENHLENIVKAKSSKKNILDMVDELPAHEIDKDKNLKTSYHEAQKEKYGF